MPDEARADTTAKRRPKSGCLGSVTVISSGGSVECENGRRASRCGLLQALAIGDEHAKHRAQLEELKPVAIVARQARRIETDDQTGVAEADLGDQFLKAATLDATRARFSRSSSMT